MKLGKFSFKDNRDTLNAMLTKPEGLLSLIDDHSRAPDSNADTLLG